MAVNQYHQARTTRPPRPDGCPVEHEWNPLGDEYLSDPYPTATELRERCPVFYADSIQYLVVTRMEDILAVFTDPETFASSNVQDPVVPLSAEAAEVLAASDFDPIAVMSNRAEPDHGRIRVFTREGFSQRRLAQLEPHVQQRAQELVGEMVRGGAPAEFVRAVAFPLPGEIVFRVIGFPESDDAMLKAWCGDRKTFAWGMPSPERQREIAEHMVAYWRYCREFTKRKCDEPGDDFTSELLAAHRESPEQLTYREVESIVYGLSFAGHDPVTALIGNSLLCLLTRRDQWDELVADHSLIPNAVEEVLRYESSQISWRRVATRDCTLGGVDVPAGTHLFLMFAAANHQPDLFPEPERFDIHRQNAFRHISFGKGIHYCLGANLAKMEARAVLAALADQVPSIRIVEGQELTRFPNITFRGPERLMVEWD
jgi:cytochrome P450